MSSQCFCDSLTGACMCSDRQVVAPNLYLPPGMVLMPSQSEYGRYTIDPWESCGKGQIEQVDDRYGFKQCLFVNGPRVMGSGNNPARMAIVDTLLTERQ